VAGYTDQEEVEKLKTWWKDYGGALLIGVIVGLGLLFGNKYWTAYKEKRLASASALYTQMVEGAQQNKSDQARASGDQLVKDYANSPYAGMAALMLARLSVDAKDLPTARTNLQWAIDNATDAGVVHTARLRLGQLYVAGGEYEKALALVKDGAPGFEAEYAELKGDAYAGLGKRDEARAAYDAALNETAGKTQARALIELKLAELAGAPTK